MYLLGLHKKTLPRRKSKYNRKIKYNILKIYIFLLRKSHIVYKEMSSWTSTSDKHFTSTSDFL